MVTAAINRPLPVRPTEPVVVHAAPLARTAPVMRPLPVPTPEPLGLVDAIRTAAFQRYLQGAGER